MAGGSNKTVATEGDVPAFLAAVTDDRRRRDARTLTGLMSEVTGQPPVLWGTAIIGFGERHYRYPSGREGTIAAVSFSPRKAATAVYLTGPLDDYADLLSLLGPHSTGKGCLYLPDVDQVDGAALRELVARSFAAAAAAG
jgi:hypothetical protein